MSYSNGTRSVDSYIVRTRQLSNNQIQTSEQSMDGLKTNYRVAYVRKRVTPLFRGQHHTNERIIRYRKSPIISKVKKKRNHFNPLQIATLLMT